MQKQDYKETPVAFIKRALDDVTSTNDELKLLKVQIEKLEDTLDIARSHLKRAQSMME